MHKKVFWLLALVLCGTVMAQDGPRILLLTKSAGYEHAVVKNDEAGNNHVSAILKKLAEENGARLTSTKDGSLINARTLADFDLVMFYTSGDLLTRDGDGSPAMPPEGIADLIAWVKAGGGFMGFHCATDNFHEKEGKVSPYIKLLGGEFVTHGKQFEGTLKVVDPSHPAVAATPNPWKIRDEWYVLKNMNKANMHVLAMLELGDERQKQKKYNIPDYPIIWCSTRGNGRVYYTAQGHRADVWSNEDFQRSIVAAARWTLGEGPAQATPNFGELVKE